MAYILGNPKSKAEVKRGLAAGKVYRVFQPGLGDVPVNGIVDLCGPHFPAPHKWYGVGTMRNGWLVKIE